MADAAEEEKVATADPGVPDAEEEEEEAPARKKFKRPSDQCSEVDADGVRCPKFSASHGGKCVAHGGWHTCNEKGCPERRAVGYFCDKHAHQKCKVKLCSNKRQRATGYCDAHRNEDEDKLEREWVERLVRDAHLREKHLDALLEKQDGRCAQSVRTCEVVEDGQATSVCQWGDRPLPRAVAQVDHVLPLWAHGSNERRNLQVLCACCHAIKSLAEARERADWDRQRAAVLAELEV